MTFVIAEACVDLKDRSCITECPVDCIYEGERMMYINPFECVDCAACEPVCPVGAIHWAPELPAAWEDYRAVNREFFRDLGAPGSATRVGALRYDHPRVAALPRFTKEE